MKDPVNIKLKISVDLGSLRQEKIRENFDYQLTILQQSNSRKIRKSAKLPKWESN